MSKTKLIRHYSGYNPYYDDGGFLEIGGGALSGATAGAMFSPIGIGVGALIGGATSIINRRFRKKQEEELLKQQNKYRENLAKTNSQAVLSTYNSMGDDIDTFAMGGVSRMIKTNPGESVELADGIQLFKGATHQNGGIPIDTNADFIQDAEVEDDEVAAGNRIYSNRLKPNEEILNNLYKETGFKFKGTYANIAESIGRKKGKINNTSTPQSNKKEEIMNQRFDSALDVLFNDQEQSKDNNEMQEYAYGGKIKKYPNGGILSIFSKDKTENDPRFISSPTKTDAKNFDVPYMITYKGRPQVLSYINKEEPKASGYVDYELPDMKKVKEAPRYDSNKRKVTDRKWFGMFNKGGTIPKYYNGIELQPKGLEVELPVNIPTELAPSPYVNMDHSGANLGGVSNMLNFLRKNKSTISNIGGQVGNYLLYLGNQKDINRMKTLQTPIQSPAPRYNYVDTTKQQQAQTAASEAEAIQNINNSSIQNKGANLARLRAARIAQDNQIAIQNANAENQARSSFNFLASRNNIYNAGAANQIAQENLNRYNDQIALGVQNRGALVKGIVGNEAVRRQREADSIRALLTTYAQGDTEVANRLMQNPILKRYFQQQGLLN